MRPHGSTTLFLLLCTAACRSMPPASSPPDSPYLLVLGTAQDAGLPQIGCMEEPCPSAHEDPSRRRLVTSLLLAEPSSGRRWLFDCTPDIREQMERAAPHPPGRDLPGPRPPLVEGIFLTHAHMGHYTGLLHFGREAYGAKSTPVHATPRFCEFLRQNGPWSLLVESGHLRLETLVVNEPVCLSDDLRVRALLVPHRDEFSDTVAFVIEGPHRKVLYLPDIDKWERWATPIEEVIAEVDYALLDGAFFAPEEIPGRDITEIPHPLVIESIARFSELPEAQRAKVHFTHLNHTNPVCNPSTRAAARVREAGMKVAHDGLVLGL